MKPQKMNPKVLFRVLFAAFLAWIVWAALAYTSKSGQHWFSLVLGLFTGIAASKSPMLPRSSRVVNRGAVALLTWIAIIAGRFVAEVAVESDSYRDSCRDITPELARVKLAESLVDGRTEDGETFDWPAQPRTGGEPLLRMYPATIEEDVTKEWTNMSPTLKEFHLSHWREVYKLRQFKIRQRILRRAFSVAYQGENLFLILGGSVLAGLLAASVPQTKKSELQETAT